MKHVVKYFESERGWGGETWYVGYDTEKEADRAVDECNRDLPAGPAPDYYIVATYEGSMEKIPATSKH